MRLLERRYLCWLVPRAVLYVLSPLRPVLAVAGMGLEVTLAHGVLSVNVETLLTGLFAGGVISVGILR